MRGLKRLRGALRVGPLPTAAALLVMIAAIALGHWQLQRAELKASMQREREQALASPATEVTGAIDPARVVGNRVAVSGRLINDASIFIDNRTRRGVAGFHVLTPLRLAGGPQAHVLVLRGWVPRDPSDRSRLPALHPVQAVVRIEGLAQAELPQAISLGTEPPPGPQDRIWQQFDFAKYRTWSGLPVAELVVRQTSEMDDGLIREWPVPGNDVAKHRGYAFQWYAIAAGTLALWAWFAFGFAPRRKNDTSNS